MKPRPNLRVAQSAVAAFDEMRRIPRLRAGWVCAALAEPGAVALEWRWLWVTRVDGEPAVAAIATNREIDRWIWSGEAKPVEVADAELRQGRRWWELPDND